MDPEPLAAWDLFGIMYTSGTTGASKGVRVTHGHAYGYSSPVIFGSVDHEDVCLITLPLFHIGGQWGGIYNALIAGASSVVLPRFGATTFWDEIRTYKCTHAWLLGVMANFLYRQPVKANDADHTLQGVIMVPVIPELEDFKRRFGIDKVSSAYGSTEASSLFTAKPGHAIIGGAGLLRDDFEARVVDENDLEVPAGVAGELIVRSKEPWMMMDGYHGMPEATLATWRNLWFHTGDLVKLNEGGHLFFLDRLKDAVRRRGENVSTQEVEQEIREHPAVLECAVVAAPSDATEDEIKVWIVLRPETVLAPEDLVKFLVPRLPYFMVPRYFEFVSELPKTPTEKIKKQELRARGNSAATWDREAAGIRLKAG